jgi:Uma2 family endonuclease
MGEPAAKLSYADYLAFEETSEQKHEFIDGLVFAMAGGSYEHARLAGRVMIALARALEGRPCNVVPSDGRLRVEASNRST